MYFTKIELHNFGIYKGTHEMHLTDKVGNRNIVLIGGLNGRGKTTFHDAILIALYGKQALKYINEKARSYEKLLSDYINKHTDDCTYIAVSLCLDDGTELRVKRSWQKKNQKIDQDTIVEKNGIIDKYLGESWSYYVEEILPFGIARFFFFNNEKITQLADDTSFEQIKSSIKSAIGVSTIEKAIDHTDEVIRRKKSALKAYESSEEYIGYQEVEKQIAEIDERLAAGIKERNSLERKCETLAAALEAKEKEFWASGGDLRRNRDAIKQEMQKISADVERIQEEILQMVTDAATPLFMCKELVIQSYDNEMISQQNEAIQYSNRVIVDLYREIMSRLSKSNLDSASLNLVKNIVNDVLKGGHCASEALNTPLKNISATSMMLYERLVANVFQGITLRIESLVNHVDAQESELLSLDAHLGAADEKTLAIQLFEVLKTAEKEKALADDEFRRQAESIESLKHQRDILVNRRIQLIKAITERENTNDDNARIIKYAAMSMEVLREFKIRLQQEKVGLLSAKTTECFKSLIEKDSLVSRIEIDPTSLDVTILDIEGHELLKNQLSAGEQQMFAVSIVWALALTSGYKAPVVIDTPMARLDSSHRANFVTKYLPAASSQVMVLSTDEEVSGRYLDLIRDNVLDYYTLLYREEEQCTCIIKGYFGEV